MAYAVGYKLSALTRRALGFRNEHHEPDGRRRTRCSAALRARNPYEEWFNLPAYDY